MGVEAETVLVDGPAAGADRRARRRGRCRRPWSATCPPPNGSWATARWSRYAETLPETVAWLERRLAGRDWREAFPKMLAAYGDLFDYAAEDAWLAR